LPFPVTISKKTGGVYGPENAESEAIFINISKNMENICERLYDFVLISIQFAVKIAVFPPYCR